VPLNTINENIDHLLKDDKISGLSRRSVRLIKSSANHFSLLIDDLDCSIIEGDNFEVNEEKFSLSLLLKEIE
jgi:hypothetical protein